MTDAAKPRCQDFRSLALKYWPQLLDLGYGRDDFGKHTGQQEGWLRGLEPPTLGTTIRCSNQLSYSHREFTLQTELDWLQN